jgi:hypothetical protein
LYPQPGFYEKMRFSPKKQSAGLEPVKRAEILGISEAAIWRRHLGLLLERAKARILGISGNRV